ncbi:MAG: PhzF family phenazine biosynthesis protein [Rhodothermales bacterium]
MDTYIVDSFTRTPFQGNPAGVCLLHTPLDEATMLQIAQELGLSETAFVHATETPGTFSIRYFSPKMEIPLCGHATLAAAKVAFERYDLAMIQFVTTEQLNLVVGQEHGQLVMDFPVYTTQPAEAPPALLAALGLRTIQKTVYNAETRILLLEIESTKTLRELAPDFEALVRSHDAINGVLVTAPATDGYDFHSRYFWPWSGTNEDPVTGGTHTFLTPYWAERLGKTSMRSFQSSARTGEMVVELHGDGLRIRGAAVIVFEGRLRI